MSMSRLRQLCPINAIAMSLLMRWCVESVDAFPDLVDKTTWYASPLLCKHTNGKEVQSYETSYENFRILYEEFDIVVSKYTHQGRGEMQRYLESYGVPLDEIKRLALYLHDALNQYYLTGIPPEATAVVAGARCVAASARAAGGEGGGSEDGGGQRWFGRR